MLVTPAAGVGRIHPDYRDASAGRHRGQPATKLAGRDASHRVAQPLATATATQCFPSSRTGVRKVKVLHHDRGARRVLSVVEQGGDGGTDPPIALGCGQPRRLHRDRHRLPERVAGRVEHAGSEVIGVEIHGQHPAVSQFLQRRQRRAAALFPRGVQIPAVPPWVEPDVVAHRAPGRDPLSPFVSAMGEPPWVTDHHVLTELADKRGRGLDP